ncbi:MAG: hypothetical protein AABY68_06095 [Pseudomonadota bacterium]
MSESVMSQAGMFVDVRLSGNYERIDFKRGPIKRAMGRIGLRVRVTAGRLVARRAISDPDSYPGKDTGQLQRALRFKVSKSGFAVVVRADKTAGMDVFYPAFLNYGAMDRKRGGDLKPRRNYVVDALDDSREMIQRELFQALKDGLKG